MLTKPTAPVTATEFITFLYPEGRASALTSDGRTLSQHAVEAIKAYSDREFDHTRLSDVCTLDHKVYQVELPRAVYNKLLSIWSADPLLDCLDLYFTKWRQARHEPVYKKDLKPEAHIYNSGVMDAGSAEKSKEMSL